MFLRYFFALCVLALFASIQACSDEEVDLTAHELEALNVDLIDDESVDARNPILLRVAMKVLQQAFKWAAKHCVKEAAENCKQHWKNPKNLVNCGKAFFKKNKGRCAAGK